jgi:hypothetical protein
MISSITFELKKQIYFFLLPSYKKISFESFGVKLTYKKISGHDNQ